MLQYSKEELLGKNPLDLTTDYHSRPLEEIGTEIITLGSTIFETEHRRKDGVIVPVEVNFHVVVIQGRKLGLAIIRDLTRRKRDEAEFRRLATDHKAIIDHAPAMIWYKDTKNNFVRVNPAAARAFGMAVNEVEGKSTYDLFPDFAETYYKDDLEVINSGKPKLAIIEPMTTASGEHLWVQTDKIPLRNEQGTITGILAFVVDITERKHAEEALALASRKLNLLSSVTRHDILNQLTALKTYIELSKDESDRQTLAKFISTEEKIADTLEQQINFTREYQDLGVYDPVWQSFHSSIETAIAALPMRNVAVKLDFPKSEVFADLLFEKVFYNLIDNALRYGGDRMTTIKVTSHVSEGQLTIVCEDDGVGISDNDKKHLFTRGFGKHTGLGLFLTREILSITGITITETGEPGKGAQFVISVPNGAYRFTESSSPE
jgi:PAS domain S-box-containing protein